MTPDKVFFFIICLLRITKTNVKTHEIPIVRLTPAHQRHVNSYLNMATKLRQPPSYVQVHKYCLFHWIDCSVTPTDAVLNILPKSSGKIDDIILRQLYQGGPNSNLNTERLYPESNIHVLEEPLPYQRRLPQRPIGKLNVLPSNVNAMKKNLISLAKNNYNINMKPDNSLCKNFTSIQNSTESELRSATEIVDSKADEIELTKKVSTHEHKNMSLFDHFTRAIDRLERKFYATTFSKLISITPVERHENGMSFVQSGIFLQLALLALSTEADYYTRAEIDECLGLYASNTDKIEMIKLIMSTLPKSSDDLKFRWASRLVLWPGADVSQGFREGAAPALELQLDRFNGTETPDVIANTLNRMVEKDSGGAIRDTFEKDELSDGVEAVLLTTLYIRGLWRSAPTVLNGSQPFRDDAPPRSVRMIRINDIMRYADLTEWDAEAVEIFYATQGLSLLILVPRGHSLRPLVDRVAGTSLRNIIQRMQTIRVAATLPLYTLRMTLLLPNKLQAMGMSRLVDLNTTESGSLRLSHAVQRIMFWAEAGRNAFKDDGIEWDDPPELELVVDRPYIFFLRWRDITLINGNFVL